MDLIQTIIFLVSISFLSFVLWENKSALFLFRAMAFSVCLLVILTFNWNWLTGKPVEINAVSSFVAILGLIIFWTKGTSSTKKSEISKKFSAKGWGITLLSFLFILFVTYLYFDGEYRVPRYTTADSGTHFLYMSGTANTGMLPLFSPSEIYPDSGNNDFFKIHNRTHFPGSSAIFYFLSKVLFFVPGITLLQIFNVALLFLAVTYLVLLTKKHLRRRLYLLFFFLVVVLGAFFDMFAASYLNEIFGIFLLLFFVDVFHKFYQVKTKHQERFFFVMSVIAFAGLLILFLYWLPVAMAFMIFVSWNDILGLLKKIFRRGELKKKKLAKIFKTFLIFTLSLILGIGYIINTFNVKLLSYATDGRLRDFPETFWSNCLFIFPFATTGFIILARKKFKGGNNGFLINFFMAAGLYSLALLLLLKLEQASTYTLFKSFHLTVPLVWLVGLGFLSGLEIKGRKFKLSTIILVVVLVASLFGTEKLSIFAKGRYENWSVIPPQALKNVKQIVGKEDDKVVMNITPDQLDFLRELKENHSYALNDGRLLFIAPPDTALWVYSASKIWPRPLSVIPEGRTGNGLFSPTSFYSKGIVDYRQWLKNDNQHYVAVFEKRDYDFWDSTSGMNLSDYNIIMLKGDNYLLKLKNGIKTRYYKTIVDDDYESGRSIDLIKTPQKTPFSDTINTQDENLTGISFMLSNMKGETAHDYFFEFSEGACEDDERKLIKQAYIRKDSIIDMGYNDIFFDQELDSKNKTYCYSFHPDNSSSYSFNDLGKPLLLWKNENGEILLREIYLYDNSAEKIKQRLGGEVD